MKIWIVGSDARAHAIAKRIRNDMSGGELYGVPGNAGIRALGLCFSYMDVKPSNLLNVVNLARRERPDLTIFSSETLLVAGAADLWSEHGLLALGPSEAAAKAEGSKLWFKEFLFNHSLPTADHHAFRHDQLDEAVTYIDARNGPEGVVLKADGLCAGKGVRLPNTEEEFRTEFEGLYREFGESAEWILVEDRLEGEEYSAIALTDGETVYPLAFTRDYKRAYDDDAGTNTGGMGAHTVSLDTDLAKKAHDLLARVVHGLRDEGAPYQGFIYLGLMLGPNGFDILECNCRGGDPETEIILSAMDGNFAELFIEAARGNLSKVPAPRQTREALGVYLTSSEYPAKSSRDDRIENLSRENEVLGATIYHGNTDWDGSHFTTNKSGRVLLAVGSGETLAEAHRIAYAAAEAIRFPGKRYRKDIGKGLLLPVYA